MGNVLLLILLIVSVIMTGLILIQRSEGGALGIGGGGGGGGFMSGRSAANSVSRMTGILGAVFLACCLLLSIVMNKENQERSILDQDNADAPLTQTLDSVEDTDPLAEANVAVTDAETETETSTEDDSLETDPDNSADEDPEQPEFE